MLNGLALAGSLGSILKRHEVHLSKTQLYDDKDDFHRKKRTHSQRLELWNNIDCNFMDTEMSWRNQDQVRYLIWQRYMQLAVLTEVSAFIAFLQMIVIYEQPLPSLEAGLSAPVMFVWGFLSISVACAAICSLFLGALSAVSVLVKGEHDCLDTCTTWGSPLRKGEFAAEVYAGLSERELLLFDAPPCVDETASFHPVKNPEGRLRNKAQVEMLWQTHFQHIYTRLRKLQPILVILFSINLSLAAYFKFSSWDWARWLCVSVPVVFVASFLACFQRLLPLFYGPQGDR